MFLSQWSFLFCYDKKLSKSNKETVFRMTELNVLSLSVWSVVLQEVRNEVAMVLAALQLYPRACETIEKSVKFYVLPLSFQSR